MRCTPVFVITISCAAFIAFFLCGPEFFCSCLLQRCAETFEFVIVEEGTALVVQTLIVRCTFFSNQTSVLFTVVFVVLCTSYRWVDHSFLVQCTSLWNRRNVRLSQLSVFIKLSTFLCFVHISSYSFATQCASIWILSCKWFPSHGSETVRPAFNLIVFLLLVNSTTPLWVSFRVEIILSLERLAECRAVPVRWRFT